MPNFIVGDKVLGPAYSRNLPIYLVHEVYIATENSAIVYGVKPISGEGPLQLLFEKQLEAIPQNGNYIALGDCVRTITDGKTVLSNCIFANHVAELLNKFPPPRTKPEQDDNIIAGTSL